MSDGCKIYGPLLHCLLDGEVTEEARAAAEAHLAACPACAARYQELESVHLALQALEDREASYLYPLAPLLEEEFCFDLADRAAQQGCYGCFIPLFEQLGEQNKLLMGRQAMENRDVLRFSMMRGRLSDSQRLQLAQTAYDADDLEFFNLSISRLSRQQRQDLMLKAYVEGRWQFYTALNNS